MILAIRHLWGIQNESFMLPLNHQTDGGVVHEYEKSRRVFEGTQKRK